MAFDALGVDLEIARPAWLWLMLVVPGLIVLMAWQRRVLRTRWRRLGQSGPPSRPGNGRLVVAFVLLVLAGIQPRWGRSANPPPLSGHDVALVIDLSQSMAARDAVPSRLGAAVREATELVRALGSQPGERVSVVGFAGRGVVLCPLTENLGAVVDVLQSLEAGSIQPGGSSLTGGVETAIESLMPNDEAPASGRSLVLFSDGENPSNVDDDPLPLLLDAGIRAHAVAIGDAENGHPIPRPQADGQLDYLVYRGETVMSRRSDERLRRLALGSGGSFVPLGLADTDLGQLYRDQILPLETRSRTSTGQRELAERYGWFVAAALLCIVWPGGPRFPARSRSRIPTPWKRFMSSSVLILTILSQLGAGRDESARRDVIQGNAAYARRAWAEALEHYEKALRQQPDSWVPYFNTASTRFQMGRFEEALSDYRKARERAEGLDRARIDFAIGNTLVALRDIPAAISHYDLCLQAPLSGPEAQTLMADARINREFAEQLGTPALSAETSEDASGTETPPSDATSEDQEPGDGEAGDSGTSEGSDVPPDTFMPPESGDDRPPVAMSSTGGGGGTRPSGAAASAETPDQRLQRAVQSIREALDRRLDPPDLPQPSPGEQNDQKNW